MPSYHEASRLSVVALPLHRAEIGGPEPLVFTATSKGATGAPAHSVTTQESPSDQAGAQWQDPNKERKRQIAMRL